MTEPLAPHFHALRAEVLAIAAQGVGLAVGGSRARQTGRGRNAGQSHPRGSLGRTRAALAMAERANRRSTLH